MTAKNVVTTFTEDEVEHLTNVTKGQLRYWDRTDFFSPSLGYEDRRRPYSRLYSFRDIVSLRVLNQLRNESRCTLPHLREVRKKLQKLGDDMWSKTTLYVLKRKVVFVNPETQTTEEVVSGQGVLQIPLAVVTGNVQKAVDEMRRRDPETVGKFERRRNVMRNQEVIAGTRIPVRAIKAFAEAGYSIRQIKQEYPTLTDDDIRAAIAHDAAA